MSSTGTGTCNKKRERENSHKYCPTTAHVALFPPIPPFPTVPGAPPQEVRGNAVNSRSLQVTWKPPPREQQNGAIIYYKIKYLKAEYGDDLSKAQEIRIEADQLLYVIGGLEKWTEYRVWVIAGTEVGDGPPSLPIILRTDEDGMYAKTSPYRYLLIIHFLCFPYACL